MFKTKTIAIKKAKATAQNMFKVESRDVKYFIYRDEDGKFDYLSEWDYKYGIGQGIPAKNVVARVSIVNGHMEIEHYE